MRMIPSIVLDILLDLSLLLIWLKLLEVGDGECHVSISTKVELKFSILAYYADAQKTG